MDVKYPMRLNENGLDITDVLAENISCVRELYSMSKSHNKIVVVVVVVVTAAAAFLCVFLFLFFLFWRT